MEQALHVNMLLGVGGTEFLDKLAEGLTTTDSLELIVIAFRARAVSSIRLESAFSFSSDCCFSNNL